MEPWGFNLQTEHLTHYIYIYYITHTWLMVWLAHVDGVYLETRIWLANACKEEGLKLQELGFNMQNNWRIRILSAKREHATLQNRGCVAHIYFNPQSWGFCMHKMWKPANMWMLFHMQKLGSDLHTFSDSTLRTGGLQEIPWNPISQFDPDTHFLERWFQNCLPSEKRL